MPVTDALQPFLTPAERVIVKSYGGWTYFMQCFGLKPWDDDDAEEGKKFWKLLLGMMKTQNQKSLPHSEGGFLAGPEGPE